MLSSKIDLGLEFEAELEGDHAGSAVAAEADAEQASGGRGGVGDGTEAGLGGRFSGDAGEDHAGQAEIGMVEDVESLCSELQL